MNPDMTNLCDAVVGSCGRDAIEIRASGAEAMIRAVLNTLKNPTSRTLHAAGYYKPDQERWIRADLAAVIDRILTEPGLA